MANELNQSSERAPFLEAAWQVGGRLCRDAIWCGDRCNWLGDAMEFTSRNWTVVHRAFGPDLYSGTSGIAFFLARLWKLTGDRIFRRTAEAALRQAWSQREALPMRISFYSGALGIAHVRNEVGALLDLETFRDDALTLVEALLNEPANPQLLDVISGSAGAIPVLLELHRQHQRDFLLELARREADNLVQTARRSDAGWSWKTLETPCKADLNGFSHGTAGIGWALLEADRVLNGNRYRRAAVEALRYERQWFDRGQENWLDLRLFDNAAQPTAPVCSLAWCHGAPGIALSRLRALDLLGLGEYRSEAEAALRTTRKSLAAAAQPGFSNFSLCHGHFGNAEALLYAAEILGGDHQQAAQATGFHAIEHYLKTQTPWPCGVPNGGETPGLMLGLAGIGYFFLRLFDPIRVPNVVMILPPRESVAEQTRNQSGAGMKRPKSEVVLAT